MTGAADLIATSMLIGAVLVLLIVGVADCLMAAIDFLTQNERE